MAQVKNMKPDIQGFDISNKSAAVIGCGGLGCNVCIHLAGAGIGKLFVCDYDTVDEANLNRQFIYTRDDIGKPKAEVMRERLSAYAPDCSVTAVTKKITISETLLFARDCDIIILAVDRADPRRAASLFCAYHGIPLVNGGIDGRFGTCYLYIPKQTPCMVCAGQLKRERSKTHSVSSTAGVIGALCASVAQRCLLGESVPAGKLMIYDGEEIHHLAVKPRGDCIVCLGIKKKA